MRSGRAGTFEIQAKRKKMKPVHWVAALVISAFASLAFMPNSRAPSAGTRSIRRNKQGTWLEFDDAHESWKVTNKLGNIPSEDHSADTTALLATREMKAAHERAKAENEERLMKGEILALAMKQHKSNVDTLDASVKGSSLGSKKQTKQKVHNQADVDIEYNLAKDPKPRLVMLTEDDPDFSEWSNDVFVSEAGARDKFAFGDVRGEGGRAGGATTPEDNALFDPADGDDGRVAGKEVMLALRRDKAQNTKEPDSAMQLPGGARMVDEHAAQESEAEGTEAHDADPHEDEELVGVQLDGESSSDDATLKFGKGDGEEDRIVTAEEASEKASLGHAEDNTDNSEAAYTNKELVQVVHELHRVSQDDGKVESGDELIIRAQDQATQADSEGEGADSEAEVDRTGDLEAVEMHDARDSALGSDVTKDHDDDRLEMGTQNGGDATSGTGKLKDVLERDLQIDSQDDVGVTTNAATKDVTHATPVDLETGENRAGVTSDARESAAGVTNGTYLAKDEESDSSARTMVSLGDARGSYATDVEIQFGEDVAEPEDGETGTGVTSDAREVVAGVTSDVRVANTAEDALVDGEIPQNEAEEATEEVAENTTPEERLDNGRDIGEDHEAAVLAETNGAMAVSSKPSVEETTDEPGMEVLEAGLKRGVLQGESSAKRDSSSSDSGTTHTEPLQPDEGDEDGAESRVAAADQGEMDVHEVLAAHEADAEESDVAEVPTHANAELVLDSDSERNKNNDAIIDSDKLTPSEGKIDLLEAQSKALGQPQQLDDAAEEVSPTVKGIISFAALERSRMPHNPPYETPKKLHFAREIGSGKTSTAVHPKQQKAVSDAKSATYIDKPGLAISRVQAQVDRAQARHSKEELSLQHLRGQVKAKVILSQALNHVQSINAAHSHRLSGVPADSANSEAKDSNLNTPRTKTIASRLPLQHQDKKAMAISPAESRTQNLEYIM